MEERKIDSMATFYGLTVLGDGADKKGRKIKNPRIFSFMNKKTKKKEKGISIRVQEIAGFAQVEYVEVSCYGEAFKDAKALDLKAGDKIDFHGWYEIKKGKTQDFPKVSINHPQQIRIFSGRAAKHNEI